VKAPRVGRLLLLQEKRGGQGWSSLEDRLYDRAGLEGGVHK